MTQVSCSLYPAFSQDGQPLAESIYPTANGQGVMMAIYAEGVLTVRGGLDGDGGFTPVCGTFRAFRTKDLLRFEAKKS